MQLGRLTLHQSDRALEAGFKAIRAELRVPTRFPNDVADAAASAASEGPRMPPGAERSTRRDARDLPLISIDPAGSLDIDQAVAARRVGGGYRLWYAIADPAAFVTPGGIIDAETHARGVTLYSPDRRTPLHPEVLSEKIASLFPGTDRPAVLWTFDLDADVGVRGVHVERATVRNRRAVGYREAQNLLDSGGADDALSAVATIGRVRAARQADRGAVDLRLPDQEIRHTPAGYVLHYDAPLAIEEWNAQISLLTGAAAAAMMLEIGTGVLRTLPRPEPATIDALREDARALGVTWSAETDYPELVRRLDVTKPTELALMYRCARALRGAGYMAFQEGAVHGDIDHYALAGPYAHVTAPLRRLSDRYANEILIASAEGRPVPEWVLAALDGLPDTVSGARRRAAALHRAQVDYMEAAVLEGRVGEIFSATVLENRGDSTVVQLDHPAVVTTVDTLAATPGSRVGLRLDLADPGARRLRFSLA
ncbi:MAG: RNB domain-containing ribonuclease [Acidimicrobiales bacterium]